MASRGAGLIDTDAFTEDGRSSRDEGDLSIDQRSGGDGWSRFFHFFLSVLPLHDG